MIDKQYGCFVIECDECHEVLETGKHSFPDALRFAAERGWVNHRVSAAGMTAAEATWTNLCPNDQQSL